MANHVAPSESVIDLGCGMGWLREMLPPDAVYYGCDMFARDKQTIVCNFNKYEFPNVSADTALISGALEYVRDWQWFLKETSNHCEKIVLSYCTRDQFPSPSVRRFWVNAISLSELLDFLSALGYNHSVYEQTQYGTIIVATENEATKTEHSLCCETQA